MANTYTPKTMADLEKWVLQQQITKVQEIMSKKFYSIFDSVYRKYANKFYDEYETEAYQRLYEFRDKVQQEIKPYVQGNSVVCGIDFTTNNLTYDTWSSFNYQDIKRYKSEGNVEAYNPDEILEDSLLRGGHGFYEYTETAPYVETLEELKNNMDLFMNELKSELSKNGFIVK